MENYSYLWPFTTARDELLTISVPWSPEILKKIIDFIEISKSSYIVQINDLPYLMQVTNEPVGFSDDFWMVRSLVLYWMPQYRKSRIVFKCFHSKCDYERYIWLSEENKNRCDFSEGKMHKCFINLNNAQIFQIIEDPNERFFEKCDEIDIL